MTGSRRLRLLAEGILYLDQGQKGFPSKKEDFHQHKMAPLEYWDDPDGCGQGEISDGCHDNSDTDGELTPDDDTPVSDDSFYLPNTQDRKNFPQPKKTPEKGIESSLLIKPLLQPQEAKKVKAPKVPFKNPLNFRAHTAQPRMRHPKPQVAKQKKIPQIDTNLFRVSKKALERRNSPNSFPRPFESVEGKPLVRNDSKGEAPKLRKKGSA